MLCKALVLTTYFDSALAEAKLLHGRDDDCVKKASDALYFSIFRQTAGKTSQKSYRMPLLDSVVSATAGQDDTYISQSSFWAGNRKVVSFKQTRAAWVDLDLYNIGRKIDSAMVAEILLHSEQLGIPAPTAIISSGRGCYLKWIFEVPVTQTQLPVWQLLQATLTTAFSSLAADFKARDASRVFRLLQTRNSKSGALVSAIDGSGKLHDFGAFCVAVQSLRGDLLIEQTHENKISTAKTGMLTQVLVDSARRGDPEALMLYGELRKPIMVAGMSAQSLNWARFCDLRDLFATRGGVKVGERDVALFWMLNSLVQAQVVRSADWNVEIEQLLQAFPDRTSFKPIEDGSMSSLLNRLKDKESGKKHKWRGMEICPMYTPSNAFLIDAFGISSDEMAGLSTIISQEEKRKRVDAKNDGRSEARNERLRWRDDVREVFCAKAAQTLAGENAPRVNLSKLAQAVGTERSRVSRFWAQLQANSHSLAAVVSAVSEDQEDQEDQFGALATAHVRPVTVTALTLEQAFALERSNLSGDTPAQKAAPIAPIAPIALVVPVTSVVAPVVLVALSVPTTTEIAAITAITATTAAPAVIAAAAQDMSDEEAMRANPCLQSLSQQRIDLALSIREAARQANIARTLALQTKVLAEKLAFQRHIAGISERWAGHKINELLRPDCVAQDLLKERSEQVSGAT